MSAHPTDTIVAIATPVGVGGIGIVRLSGSEAQSIIYNFWQSRIASTKTNKFKPRYMYLGWLKDGDDRVDEAISVYFKAPFSYTGEDVVEIHTHSSSAVLSWAVDKAIEYGARLAEPGEFTKRAFLNNKIDATQAEAVLDIINAQSVDAAKLAADQLSGALSSLVAQWRQQLISISASETAFLDFGDEDIVGQSNKSIDNKLAQIQDQIEQKILSINDNIIQKEGITAAIIGLPNAGKSTLLNRLLNYSRSIVTDIAGTTRDHIEEKLIIGNTLIRLIDTAGLNDAPDKVEEIGIKNTVEIISRANLVLLLIAPSKSKGTIKYLKKHKIEKFLTPKNTIIVYTKSDLEQENKPKSIWKSYKSVSISAKTNKNIIQLKRMISNTIKMLQSPQSSQVSTIRHLQLLNECSRHLTDARKSLSKHLPRDIVLVDIDSAVIALNQLSGEDIDEQKIVAMFANFCIGK